MHVASEERPLSSLGPQLDQFSTRFKFIKLIQHSLQPVTRCLDPFLQPSIHPIYGFPFEMPVKSVTQLSQLQNEFREAGKKLVVIDFYADWCGPCRMIAPILEQMSNEYKDAVFIKVNVDHSREIAGSYRVSAMPTFVFVSETKEVDRMQGAQESGLRMRITYWINKIGPTSKPNLKAATPDEKQWLSFFVQYTDQVKQYEDEINQVLAKSACPLDTITAKATIDGKLSHYELARGLLKWFHGDFFTWYGTHKCHKCGAETPANTNSNGIPTNEEYADGAGRVEVSRCPPCNVEVRFPRYTNVQKLLETRKGRCGEWANAFALFCRAANLDTRLVIDRADHVWVEIYADELNRWVHCDPCENVIDTPLMYERGWNKKLDYVVGIARDHVNDVTWRYTFDRQATTKRRTKCRPEAFWNFLEKLNLRLSKDLPADRKKYLEKRFHRELIEFIWPRNNLRNGSEAENHGRISGDRKWREDRGETSTSTKMAEEGTVIQPTKTEIEGKVFELTYNCATDTYFRPTSSDTSANGWKSFVQSYKNLFRKEENDWKKAYIARTEGSPKGEIVWKVDFSEAKPSAVNISLGDLFSQNGGKIFGTVCCGDQCVLVGDDGKVELTEGLESADYLEIRLEFSGGSGDNAWQQAQLFRTDLDNADADLRIHVQFA